MKIKVVVFPGSNCDHDTEYVFGHLLKQDVQLVWHKEEDLGACDLVILPGGFAYGDYLRTGAMARFSPIMKSVEKFAKDGGYVFGICNGFQVLCEAGLLPGALMKNDCLQFRCIHVNLRVETTRSPLTKYLAQGQVFRIPIAHGDGSYYADPDTIQQLIDEDCVLFQYSTPDGLILPEANPNGSLYNIAGICNRERNVFGMMPHPERACEIEVGSSDGLPMLQSLVRSVEDKIHSTQSESISVA
ncbi:MAG TPA: phosphoribosylformylglycinamidine synthase subunit PurQ [Acidobacteriota bacterium]|jgi:phosphoribosylformylglycinamidine synthase|nr:phosphoribosylformylglycinamidine synthase subunit PurQ [Acidobacteriota bacterium]